MIIARQAGYHRWNDISYGAQRRNFAERLLTVTYRAIENANTVVRLCELVQTGAGDIWSNGRQGGISVLVFGHAHDVLVIEHNPMLV